MDAIQKANQIKRYYQNEDGLTTLDLLDLASGYNIKIITADLGTLQGAYYCIQRMKTIFLNENLNSVEKRFVLAHEIGHAILHRNINCFYLKKHTLMKTSIYELEANRFSSIVLLPSKIPIEYQYYNLQQIACMYDVPLELAELKYGR